MMIKIDMIQMVKDLMKAQGIEAHLLKAPFNNIQSFDGGFRKQLFKDYDYSGIIEQLEHNCKEDKVYMVTDQFEVHYYMFKIPLFISGADSAEYFSIGPYLLESDAQDISEIIERNQLLLYHTSDLKEYYYGIPVIAAEDTLESIIFVLIRYLFGKNDFIIDRTGISFYEIYNQSELMSENEDKLSMDLIDERYQYEDEMLGAIEQGDFNKAITCSNALKKYRLQPRTTDSLRDYKNIMVVTNSLYRKSAQKAKVHPAHIDRISTSFAKRIESSGNRNELKKIHHEMIRKYCFLVQNHSLRGYSPVIQNVINYIDFNLTEPLTLKYIAEIVLVNSSYLSAQFKKETGKNITDYINKKRIQSSLVLLTTTNLSIQSIAEKVGIYDENYFSRLFKRMQNMTAREYRNSLNNKI